MRKVRESYPDAITFFVRPGSTEEIERRLRGRDTEDSETINRRLEVARAELRAADQFQYQIVNDRVDQAVDDIGAILSQLGE